MHGVKETREMHPSSSSPPVLPHLHSLGSTERRGVGGKQPPDLCCCRPPAPLPAESRAVRVSICLTTLELDHIARDRHEARHGRPSRLPDVAFFSPHAALTRRSAAPATRQRSRLSLAAHQQRATTPSPSLACLPLTRRSAVTIIQPTAAPLHSDRTLRVVRRSSLHSSSR